MMPIGSPNPFTKAWKESMEEKQYNELRDYFAAHALQGLLSNPKLEKKIIQEGGAMSGWVEYNAYAYADAMMEVREKDCS